jgi:hypothetical protein
MAINIADIITEYGLYYKKGSQNLKNLHLQLFETNKTDELFPLMPTDDTRIEGANVDIGHVLQAYLDDFTPFGDTTFVGKIIELYKLKADLKEMPDKLERSWLGFLAANGNDRKTWPFVRWWIEKLIFPRMKQDWEHAIFKGTVAATVAGTPNPVLTGVYGFRQQLNDGIAAGNITPIVLGAVPAANTPAGNIALVDYVEAFVDGIPPLYLPYLQTLAMSNTNFRRFKKGMRLKYNMSYDQAEITKVLDTDLSVNGYISHEGSPKMWTTVRGNTALGVKKIENESVFAIESIDRQVKIFTDFYKGVGYFRGDFLFTNDVDLN